MARKNFMKAAEEMRFTGKPRIPKCKSVCMRCGGSPLVIVPNTDPKAVGANAHAALCAEMCASRPWRCPKCEGVKAPEHTDWCEVGHPGYLAKWEADRRGEGGQLLKLATMLAMRGEVLPDWLMRTLFDQAA
jgi:hypothetical protein